MKFKLILFGMGLLFRFARWRSAAFRERLAQRDLTVVLRTADGSIGRTYVFAGGGVTSRAGIDPNADLALIFKTAEIGARLLMPPIDQLEQIEAMKNFLFHPEGHDEDAVWFAQTVMTALGSGWKIGRQAGDGVTRFCTMTNGGPLFVYVKDGKIRAHDRRWSFDDDDAPSFTIKARGRELHAAAQGGSLGVAWHELEGDGLCAQSPADANEAGRPSTPLHRRANAISKIAASPATSRSAGTRRSILSPAKSNG